jgi:hypothetical protein
MKKIAFLIILVSITGVSLFAWEPIDLTDYPRCTGAGNWLINVGIGMGGNMGASYNYGADYITIPPIHATVDTNIPLGGLPFFFGAFLDYQGSGFKGNQYINKWFYSTLNLGARIGYHFNWGIDNLDTYALIKAGWSIYFGDTEWLPTDWGWPVLGLTVGGRYYFIPMLGAWLEAGIGSYYSLGLGVTLKF